MTTRPSYLSPYPSGTLLWTLLKEGTFLVRDVGEPVDDIHVTSEELNRLHPQFSNAVLARMELSRKTEGFNVVYAAEVVCTLEMLNGLSLSFVDVNGHQKTVALSGALDAVPDGRWRISGRLVQVHHFTHEGADYPYVVSAVYASSIVSSEELDARYPGWNQRWLTASELGLPLKDCFAHVFLPQTHGQAQLPCMEL